MILKLYIIGIFRRVVEVSKIQMVEVGGVRHSLIVVTRLSFTLVIRAIYAFKMQPWFYLAIVRIGETAGQGEVAG
jgi:hypothetical protein